MNSNVYFLILGWLSYHLLVMYELKLNNASLNPVKYLAELWAKVGLSVTGAIMAYHLAEAGLPSDAHELLIVVTYMSAGLFPYQAFDYLGKKLSNKNLFGEMTSEKLSEPEFVKKEKFEAHDLTTWVRRK